MSIREKINSQRAAFVNDLMDAVNNMTALFVVILFLAIIILLAYYNNLDTEEKAALYTEEKLLKMADIEGMCPNLTMLSSYMATITYRKNSDETFDVSLKDNPLFSSRPGHYYGKKSITRDSDYDETIPLFKRLSDLNFLDMGKGMIESNSYLSVSLSRETFTDRHFNVTIKAPNVERHIEYQGLLTGVDTGIKRSTEERRHLKELIDTELLIMATRLICEEKTAE